MIDYAVNDIKFRLMAMTKEMLQILSFKGKEFHENFLILSCNNY